VELPPKPVEAPKPVEVAPPVEVAKPVEPPKPVEVAKPVEPPKPVEPQKPATVQPTPPAQEPSGGGGKWVVIVLLLLAIGGAVFWFVVKPMMTKVSVKTAPALLADVTSNFSTPAKVKASEPTVLKLGAAGKVQKLVDEGKSVTAGETLVELDSFAAIGKAQVDAQKALDGLKKKLETGKLKGKAAADLQAKITEKQNKIAELETQGKAARLVAEKDGAVAKVLVKQGQAVTAGTDAVSVADKGLVAELQVPANDSASLSGGQTIALCNTGKTLSIKATIKSVTKQDSQNVVQIALPADAAVKAGDELLVEKGKIEQVASLPATAVVDGKVFIVKDGKVATVAVAVAGQESSSVLVKGLTGGEQVIQARSPELHDGVEVEIAR
ncbi:MAG TPA: efflux RND transporter periplasmic adaptor subunit, partial [Pseudomonadota bacterium]|nr:efflux RND transporter periplasmic adaptor subunit [Pseudomonadota bacterium]